MYSSQSYRQFAESLRNYYHHHNHNHNHHNHESYHNSNYPSRYPMVNAYNGHHYSAPAAEPPQLLPFPAQRYVVNTCITSDASIVAQNSSHSEDCQKFMAHTIQQHITGPPVPNLSPSRAESGSPGLDITSGESAQNRNHHNHHWW